MGIFGFIRTLFYFLTILFVLRIGGIVLRAFLGGLFKGMRPAQPAGRTGSTGGRSGSTPRGQIEELVRDPICGVHTAMSAAIAGRYQGSSAYFCSPECAAKAQAA